MIKELLDKGLFPSQMPPCFSGEAFADYCVKNTVPGVGEQKKDTKPEKYSVARAGHFRRPTVIVNPHQYYFLTKEIADNQAEIEAFYGKSTISKSVPRFVTRQNRAIAILPTRELAELKLLASAGYKYALITDIAQFFPSIYTHSIAWALLGKKNVKAALGKKKSGPALPPLGDNLDTLTRHLNANQTIGLPIGPDSSHIIAEIIGVAMDVALQERVPKLVGFRYVDDYSLYFERLEDAESCLAALTAVLAEFELNINATKTRIAHVSEVSSDYWTHELKSFTLSRHAKKQKRDILHFFDVSLSIAHNNADENVMKFALKKMASKVIFKRNWPVLEANLLRVILIHPNAIIDVAHILHTYHVYDYEINKASVGRTMNAIIREHAPLGHHSEVAWALWILADLEIAIQDDAAEEVPKMNSSPCLLLLYHLYTLGLCSRIDNTVLKTKSAQDGPYGDMWLAVYEARVQGYFKPSPKPLAGTFFATPEKQGIRFFDVERKPKPMFKVKPTLTSLSWFDEHSDYYDEEDVEFDDIPDDYSDRYYEDEEADDGDDDEDEDDEDEEDPDRVLQDMREISLDDDPDDPWSKLL